MRKAILAIGTILAIGGGVLLIDLDDDGIADVSLQRKTGNVRLAISDQVCPLPGENGWDYLQLKCLWHKTKGDWCACVTEDMDTLAGEITDLSVLPDAAFRRMVVCRHKDDNNVWQVGVYYAKLGQAVPDGWVCEVIHNRLLQLNIPKLVKTQRELALEEKCGFDIDPSSWGCCPYCLVWPEGCPPCRSLCKYERNWEGHEGECNG